MGTFFPGHGLGREFFQQIIPIKRVERAFNKALTLIINTKIRFKSGSVFDEKFQAFQRAFEIIWKYSII